MGDESYQSYRDSRRAALGLATLPAREEQLRQLSRVQTGIGAIVLAFCREREGKTFHAEDLFRYVRERHPTAAGSPDRILRKLMADGAISYTVLSRSRSLYHLTAVRA